MGAEEREELTRAETATGNFDNCEFSAAATLVDRNDIIFLRLGNKSCTSLDVSLIEASLVLYVMDTLIDPSVDTDRRYQAKKRIFYSFNPKKRYLVP